MTDSLFSAQLFLVWHEWARVLALSLLAVMFVLAVVRFAAAGSDGAVARLFNRRSLRVDLLLGLLVVGTIPAISLGIILAERSANLRHDRLAGYLQETAHSVASEVDHFIDKHVAGVSTAAAAISLSGQHQRDSLPGWLLLYHKEYADFLTMLFARPDGTIVSATSNMSGFLAPVSVLVGHNVSDRPYFYSPMADGRTFVSRVFQGRDLGRDPIVAVSAAVLSADGVREGVIEGSLNLRRFARFNGTRLAAAYATLIIVDQDNRVIYADDSAGYEELQPIAGEALIRTGAAAMTGTSFRYADDSDHWYLGARAMTDNGWTVYLRAPLQPIAQQMLGDYGVGMLLLLWAVVLSLLLAGGLLRRLTRHVTQMNAAIDALQLDGTKTPVDVPADTPVEFQPVYDHMHQRSTELRKALRRLANSMKTGEKLRRELVHSIASKDAAIADRTAELEEANERLSEMTLLDALTGIANRRAFEAFLLRVWRQAVRERTAIAVVMVDIDHFKPFNDSMGHQAGDDTLKRVAATLQGCAARPLDLVARYGGEEFVAVLVGASESDAKVVAERMRRAIFDLQVAHRQSAYGVVTISAGVASAQPAANDDMAGLVRAADEALYHGKANGRNAVTGASGIRADAPDGDPAVRSGRVVEFKGPRTG